MKPNVSPGKLFPFFILLPFILFAQPIDMNEANAQDEFMWGVNAFHNGYLGKALHSFEAALRLSPQNGLIKTWLARAYFRLGFEDTALAMWKDLLQKPGKNPLLEYQVSSVELRRGLGRELTEPDIFIINHELAAGTGQDSFFQRPSSVFSLPDAKYVLVAYGSNELLYFNANSQLLSRIRGGIPLLSYPFDIISNGQNYYVSEFEGNVISLFDRNFVKLKSFGGKGIAEGKLLGPQFLALDQEGYLYVSDWGNRRVCKFDSEGNFILAMGKNRAIYPFEKLMPTGLAVHEAKLYVADQFKNQIVVFDLSGNYLSSFGEGFLKSPEGITFYNNDILLVADGSRVLAYSLKNEAWKVWAELEGRAKRLVGLRLTPNQDLLAADFDANKLFLISDASSLHTGFFVQILRVDSRSFPVVTLDVVVADILGQPIVGLTPQNFLVTEDSRAVNKLEVLVSNTDGQPLSAVVLVEDSPELDAYTKELMLCLENIAASLGPQTRLKVVFARQQASLEADLGKFDLARLQAQVASRGASNWAFDVGIRSTINELATERGRLAVIFLCSGVPSNSAYKLYTLQELTAGLRNNSIRFYPVYLGSYAKNPDYEYMAKETGGSSYNFFDAEGLKNLFKNIITARASNYILRYNSPSDSGFGRRYIPLEVQVAFYKRTGRDESGYYGPLVTK